MLHNTYANRPQLDLDANPSLSFPVQVMLDGGSASASKFFITINLKEAYYSVMGLVLTWLSAAYPSQYPLSTGLFYHGKAIPHLRQRLSKGFHDDETYVNILYVMQTEVRPEFPSINQRF
jgi:hypothetical protein